MSTTKLTIAHGGDELVVEQFSAREAISSLFAVNVMVTSRNPAIEPHHIVGKAAALQVASNYKFALDGGARCWTGVCTSMRQMAGHSTQEANRYQLRIMPALWLLTQRVDRRIFQRKSVPDIVALLLSEWQLKAAWHIDRGDYPKRDFMVQYGESDYAFMARLLQDEGIAYYFIEQDGHSVLTFADNITEGEARSTTPLPYANNATEASGREFVGDTQLGFDIRPGAAALLDHDFRHPRTPQRANAKPTTSSENLLEQVDYRPGVMQALDDGAPADNTPVADDRGQARHALARGEQLVRRRLDSMRTNREGIHFFSNAINLRPVTKFSMDHPHPAFGKRPLMVTQLHVQGAKDGEWHASGYAVFANEPYRPPLEHLAPVISGPQSAMVMGPTGGEIHCDEFGRVRVLFPWDRDGTADDSASCWVRVSQGWAGTGFGMQLLPRVGQEVLVAFENGSPDRPVILGRGYNGSHPAPYKLPKRKTISTWRSKSTPNGDGFNELLMDDAKGEELLQWHAQKNLRQLVKHDEVATVGQDRDVLVKQDLQQTADRNRVQVQEGRRAELSDKERIAIVSADDAARVKSNRHERWRADHHVRLGSEQHAIGKQQRVGIDGDSHLLVRENSHIAVDKKWSRRAAERHVKVATTVAAAAGFELHFNSGGKVVAEAGASITLKGGSGVVHIDASGVTVKGPLVRINSGGAAGSGSGCKPKKPKWPRKAKAPKPPKRLREVRAKAKEYDVPLPEVRGWPKEKDTPEVAVGALGQVQSTKDDDKKLTWIGIELVDDDGKPVAGERYEITLPDGRKRRGVTDKDGKARVEGIDPGTCQVTFPKLDRDVWRKG